MDIHKRKWKETKKRKTFCKLYMCFRPVTMDGNSMEIGPVEGDHQKGIVRNCLNDDDYNKEEGLKLSSPPYQSSGEITRKKACRRSLSRLVKAVMFGASLANKIKKRELLQKIRRANGSASSTISKKDIVPKKSNKSQDQLSPTNTTTASSSSFCSSCTPTSLPFCSSCNSSSTSSKASSKLSNGHLNFMNSKVRRECLLETGKGRHSCNVGLCLVLLILLFLVLWGKTCAILCTAACLFLVPKSSGAAWKAKDDSKCSKKIMN